MAGSRFAELDGHIVRLRRHVRITEPQASNTERSYATVDRYLRCGRMYFAFHEALFRSVLTVV